MKKILLITSLILSLCIENVSASNIIHTFTDEKWVYITKEWKIMDTGLDTELNDGPGYEMLKEKYDTGDFDVILSNEDKNYGLDDSEAIIIKAPKDAKSVASYGDDMKLSVRDKMLQMKEDGINKKEEKRQEKVDEEDVKEKGSMKVRIGVSVDKSHPNNPTFGQSYNKMYVFYTDCETLGDVLRENDLTSDSSFLTVLDGIDGSVTTYEWYSDDFMHGKWEGYSWMIYKNGKQTNVGMEDLKIIDGCSYRLKAEFQKMEW